MSARQKDLLRNIEYPESDGKPMAETDKHIQQMIDLRFALPPARKLKTALTASSLNCVGLDPDNL